MTREGRILIGIDGGGTGCRAALLRGDDTRVEAEAGRANLSTDFTGAVRSVQEAVAATAARAGLDTAALEHAAFHIGLAGMRPALRDRLAAALPWRHVSLASDRDGMVHGALGGQEGIVAAIGTGSTFGALRGGAVTGLGGHGHHLGDQASGAWLVRRALTEALLAHDGLRPATGLTDTLLAGQGGADGIVSLSMQARGADYAALAGRVTEAAKAGDAVAVAIMEEGAAYIRAAVQRLSAGADLPLVFTGGLGPAWAEWTGLPATPPRGTALDGALALAARLAA